MLPRRALVRTSIPQEEEVNVNGSGSIQGVAAVEHQLGLAVPRVDGSSTLEQFLRLHLPNFKGEVDPWGEESWLKKVTKIFDSIQVADERWLTLVPYILEDEADFWWDMVTRTKDVDQ